MSNSRPRVTEAGNPNAFVLPRRPFHDILDTNSRTNLPSCRRRILHRLTPILKLPILREECPSSVRFGHFGGGSKGGIRRQFLGDIFTDVLFDLSYGIHDVVVEVFEWVLDGLEQGKERAELVVCFHMTLEFVLEASRL
jgi:hypothetical protein